VFCALLAIELCPYERVLARAGYDHDPRSKLGTIERQMVTT
jgi:hypothetical protein